jgi:8-oxo-dGTP diphosphatase
MKREGILCFLKQNNDVLLILVDYGNKVVWNGVSGYIDPNENREDAVVREVKEEIGVSIDSSTLQYKGTHRVSDNLNLYIFTAIKWEGDPEPKEKSIKEVRWFAINNLPFQEMFEDNKNWISDLLKI